ncbi:MAG: ABC transporter permease [Candidatus Thermochlorobacter sp.]
MNKVAIVIRKEYLERVKSIGFILSTVLVPILMSSFIIVPLLLQLLTNKSDLRIAIIDKTQKLKANLQSAFEKRKSLQIVFADFADENEREIFIKETDLGKLNGYLVVRYDSAGQLLATYTSKNTTDFELLRSLENGVRTAARHQLLAERGFSEAEIQAFEKPISFQTQKLSGGKTSDDSGIGSFIISYVMALLIYATLIGYGNSVSAAVIEEKSSKVMEVLISSVKPVELMMGKIIGVGLVALTQYAIWVVAALVLSGLSLQSLSGSLLPKIGFELPTSLLFYFVLYFLLGYLIYATLYAATGSGFETAQDAQSLQFPITALVVVAILFVQIAISKPESPLAVGLSLVPFFAPVLMIARMSVTDVPFWQISLSLALMVITFYAVLWASAKIYRMGVLMYGKKPSLGELFKWLRYS